MKEEADHLIELSQDKSVRALEESRKKARWGNQSLEFKAGREKGKEEGREEGREEIRERLVLSMLLKNLDMDLISELSGWTEERILKLKNKI